jgi:HD domain
VSAHLVLLLATAATFCPGLTSIGKSPSPEFYAHSLEGEPPAKWQALKQHLLNVAKLAAQFAKAFDSESWGYCAGLWHDVGKYQAEFQQRLLGSQISVEHSGAGAALTVNQSKGPDRTLASPLGRVRRHLTCGSFTEPLEQGPGFGAE